MGEDRIAVERFDAAQREWERHDRIMRILLAGVRGAIQLLEAVVDAVEQHGIRSPKDMQQERSQHAQQDSSHASQSAAKGTDHDGRATI